MWFEAQTLGPTTWVSTQPHLCLLCQLASALAPGAGHPCRSVQGHQPLCSPSALSEGLPGGGGLALSGEAEERNLAVQGSDCSPLSLSVLLSCLNSIIRKTKTSF